MSGYAKVFSRILDSTIWREDDTTRILWITMLALADRYGEVHCTIPGLADRARITLAECEHALERFHLPDKYSWSQEDDGRRIRTVEGGWFLINHAKYRELMSAEDRREKTRVRVAKFRRNAKTLPGVTGCTNNACNDIAEAEADTKEKEQNLSASPERLPSFPLDFSQFEVEHPPKSKPPAKHTAFKELIFKCYAFLNDGEKAPWDGSDAKQLSLLLKAKPDLLPEKFHEWLISYAKSDNINPADRPRVFLPKITSFSAGSLDKFGRPLA